MLWDQSRDRKSEITGLVEWNWTPISAIMMAIVLGMLVANTIKLPDSIQPGLRFCTSAILKIGIILLGIRLSLTGAGQFTLVALPFVIAAIAIGLFTVGLLGRYLGLSRQLSGLIAVGTSICGCTAIVATAPLIRANESEVSYAVACITVFGLAAMFFYPVLAHQVFATRFLLLNRNWPAFFSVHRSTKLHRLPVQA